MVISGLLGLGLGFLIISSVAIKQPNILFIGTDQQRTSTIRAYGNDWAYSPNIDKLASEGVLFTDAYTVSPVCSPSRTSVLTGVHVPIHGVYENGITQFDNVENLTPYFDVLKKAGYATALIGKTHFSPIPASIDHLDAHTGNSDMRGPTTTYGDFLETYLVNRSMEWIQNVTSGGNHTPFFLYTSMVSPHPPNWVPKGGPWSSAYTNTTLPPLNYREHDIEQLPYQTRMLLGLLGRERDDPPAFPGSKCDGSNQSSSAMLCPIPNMSFVDAPMEHGLESPSSRFNYYALAAYVDHEVGRLLNFIDKEGLKNSTFVVFASDHGSALYDHGIANDKHNFLDPSLRIPMIMRYPGIIPAAEKRAFATTLDLPATFIALAAGPEKIPRGYAGFDLVGPISSGQSSPRKIGVSCEYRAMALVTPSWKLAYFPEQGEGRLWDRRADPEEQLNLFDVGADVNSTQWIAKQGLLLALLRWRAQQDPLAFLDAHLDPHPEASVATIVVNHTSTLKGIDAEMRLQVDALKFEPKS